MCICKVNFINFELKSSSEEASIQTKWHIVVKYLIFFVPTGFEINECSFVSFQVQYKKLTEIWSNWVKPYYGIVVNASVWWFLLSIGDFQLMNTRRFLKLIGKNSTAGHLVIYNPGRLPAI